MKNCNNLENILRYTDHDIRIKYLGDRVNFLNDSEKVAILFIEMTWDIPNENKELQTVCYQIFSTLLVSGGSIEFDHKTLDELFNPKYAPTDGTYFPEGYQVEVPESAVCLKYTYIRFHPKNGLHFHVHAYVYFLQ